MLTNSIGKTVRHHNYDNCDKYRYIGLEIGWGLSNYVNYGNYAHYAIDVAELE